MGKPYLGYEESEAGLVGGLQGGPLSTGDMRVRNILNKWKTLTLCAFLARIFPHINRFFWREWGSM